MTPRLKPYPAMKDSGVQWLGEVPEHWELRRTKTILRERVEKGFPKEPLLAATQTKGVVRKEQYENRTVLALKDLHLLKLVREGDFVISLRSFQGGIEYAREQGIISPAYTVLRPVDDQWHGFLSWIFKSKPYVQDLSLFVTGIRQGQNIDYEKLSRSALPLPPLREQTAIVRYLQYADRRIRRYIHAKQKLIKLLEEEKQAIIHRAVTRGLDPDVPMKDSGVEWLGEVPEHWEVKKVGRFAAVGNGSTPSRGNPGYWDGGDYPWLNSSAVNAGVITDSHQFVTRLALAECHLPRVPVGSVLVAITGQGKTRGMAAVLTIEATINQHIAFITPRGGHAIPNPEYLRLFFVAAYSELRRLSDDSGSTKGALTCAELRQFHVALPPVREQHRIAETVAASTAETEETVRLAQREIALLREYRTRLIADVVTGKLDVRDAEALLPDEMDDSESLDEVDPHGDGDEATADDLDPAFEEAEA